MKEKERKEEKKKEKRKVTWVTSEGDSEMRIWELVQEAHEGSGCVRSGREKTNQSVIMSR